MNRPRTRTGSLVATREDASIIDLLGGETYEGVSFTKDQVSRLWQLYRFETERDHIKNSLDVYQDRFFIAKRGCEAFEKLLKEEGLEFSVEITKNERAYFTVKVPRRFQGRNINPRDCWSFGIETGRPFRLRSWKELQKRAVESTKFKNTGGLRNLFRFVLHDGLRLMALLSQYCEADEDPVLLVAQALANMGYDVTINLNEEEFEENGDKRQD